jgi:uncharacterized protein
VDGLQIAEGLTLPPETTTSTLVVYGGKGMGKTNFSSVLVEELARIRQRFSVIDPVGVWYGLRHGADGVSPGIEALILGGRHGDLEIDPVAGGAVADLVADEDVDVIIDISGRKDGSMWSSGEKIRFVADYCTRLFERQGERRRPLHQAIDEAGRFVPQMIPSGAVDIARCVGAIEQLVELGRNVGVGVTLITQRSARMNKSVSELADAMVAFRTVGPRSIDAVMDWLGEHVERGRVKGLVEQLRTLPVGSALVVSPGWLQFEGIVAMRARQTFDSSATPDVHGAVPRASGPAARPDLERYRQRFSAAEAEPTERKGDGRDQKRAAAEQARLISEQQQRIAELERQVRELSQRPAFDSEPFTRDVAAFESAAMRLIDSAGELKAEMARGRPAPAIQAEAPNPDKWTEIKTKVADRSRGAPARVVVTRPVGDVVTPTDLSNPQVRILEALASFRALGIDSIARSNVAVFSDQSPRSSGFANNLGALRTRDLIEYPNSGAVAITDAGLSCIDEPMPIRSLAQLHEAWYAKLPRPQANILRALVSAHPGAYSREALARLVDQSPTSSGYANNLGALRSLGLVSYPSRGRVVATGLLFPEGPR